MNISALKSEKYNKPTGSSSHQGFGKSVTNELAGGSVYIMTYGQDNFDLIVLTSILEHFA